MSTKTNIFEFIKPEMTDAATITATNENWDKIEDELVSLNLGEFDNNINVNGGHGYLYGSTSEFVMMAKDDPEDDDNSRYLSIDPKKSTDMEDSLRFIDNTGGVYTIKRVFGEHNKPSGKYIGNSSSATRTINIGGIGEVLYLYDDIRWALISRFGAIWKKDTADTISGESLNKIRFQDGVLTISGNNTVFNLIGTEYHYQVL